mgnify:CR=1 FL=1
MRRHRSGLCFGFAVLLALTCSIFPSPPAAAGTLVEEIRFDRQDLTFLTVGEYDVVTLRGADFTSEVGAPCLPAKTIHILLPPSKNNLSLYLKCLRLSRQLQCVWSIADNLELHIRATLGYLPEGLEQTIYALVSVESSDKGDHFLIVAASCADGEPACVDAVGYLLYSVRRYVRL